VHGLPPADGQKVDVTTARDFAILCRELAKRTEVFTYTGTRARDFRGGQFIMRNHNHLLNKVDGCDGFKTGYFEAAGYSIAATAKRNGVRIIAIVMGSKDRKVRDAKAAELLAKGFAVVPVKQEPAVAANQAKAKPDKAGDALPADATKGAVSSDENKQVGPTAAEGGWGKFFAGLGIGFVICAALAFLVLIKRTKGDDKYLRRR